MPPIQPRQRLAALAVIGLLVTGGAAAGVALRPDGRLGETVTQVTPAAAREALRHATSLSDAFIAMAEAVTPAVVRIEVERTMVPDVPLTGTLQDLFNRAPSPDSRTPVPQIGGGSGFVVSPDGYILTNNHVIADADRITVMLRDKRRFPARVVGADPATDVAVIRIDAEDLPVVPLGDSDAARVGEWVLAIGNPGFEDARPLDFTVTSGIISAKGRPLDILNVELLDTDPDAAAYAIEDFIQTDAVINPGNSGGPLVDLRGTVIGINTAIASTTGLSQGYGFAIPSNLAQRVMRDLIAHGYVRRPILGIAIADVTPEDAEVYGLERIAGVVVEDFAPDSPAERAGLQRHDVVVAVDGVPVERVGQLQRLVALHEPGESARLEVIRYGERLHLQVRLMEAAGAGPRPQRKTAPVPGGLGLEVEELTPSLAQTLGYSDAGGTIVSRVVPGSAADRKDIGVNHRVAALDRRTRPSVDEVAAAIRTSRSGQILSLLMEYPDGRTYIANIRVP